ncbi:hypothetical protein [Sinorhizobium meliloti]
MFADLVHFTDLAENLSPVHLVELLKQYSAISTACPSVMASRKSRSALVS